MILGDAEFGRMYWANEKMLKVFGNGLPKQRIGKDEIFDDPLHPEETFLEFNDEFCNACALDPVDSMGTYCMGWQL